MGLCNWIHRWSCRSQHPENSGDANSTHERCGGKRGCAAQQQTIATRKDAKTQAHSTHQAALSEYFDLTLDAKRNLMKLCAFIFKPSSYYSMIFFAGTLVATTTVAFVFVMRTILKELDIKPSLPSLPSINLPFKKRSVQTANI